MNAGSKDPFFYSFNKDSDAEKNEGIKEHSKHTSVFQFSFSGFWARFTSYFLLIYFLCFFRKSVLYDLTFTDYFHHITDISETQEKPAPDENGNGKPEWYGAGGLLF